jgi:hypothetical protein
MLNTVDPLNPLVGIPCFSKKLIAILSIKYNYARLIAWRLTVLILSLHSVFPDLRLDKSLSSLMGREENP